MSVIPVVIEARVLGKKKSYLTDWWIELPPVWERGGDRLRLRDLITRVVVEEVEGFEKRQQEQRMTRFLSKQEIEQGAARGKIDSGGRGLIQPVDREAAIANALQAFEDGLYFVFIDDVQHTKLDQEVSVMPKSKVKFLRLVALVGG